MAKKDILEGLKKVEDLIVQLLKDGKDIEDPDEFDQRLLNGFRTVKNMVRAAYRAIEKNDEDDAKGKGFSALKTLKQLGGQVKVEDSRDTTVKMFDDYLTKTIKALAKTLNSL